MPEEPIFGELNEAGAIIKNTRVSALSGRFTEPGDPTIHIPGTNVFYRLEAQDFRKLNDERYADEAAEMRKAIAAKPGYPTSTAPIAPPEIPAPEATPGDDNPTPGRRSKGVTNG